MDALKLINIRSSILRLKILQNGHIAVIDENTALRILDVNTFRVIDGFKSSIVHQNLLERQVDVSSDGALCISLVPGSEKAAVFDVPHKQLLYRIGRHKGDIESVAIDPNGRYCVTGGQDGKVFVWSLKNGQLVFSIPSHADFVTSLAFSQNGQWIASGSYDRSINLINLATMKQHVRLRGHNSVIISMLFLTGLRLLSAERDGSVLIWDLHNSTIFKRLPKVSDEISCICLSNDKRFAFVATRLGYVALYDLKSYELIRQRYLKFSETITSMAFIESKYALAIGTKEGNVHIYSLLGDESLYQSLITNHDYRTFHKLIEDNPMLIYSKSYSDYEIDWNNSVQSAKRSLESGDKNRAKELLEPFIGIPAKTNTIQQLLRDYEKYSLFISYVTDNRYPLAYSLVKQYPSFKDSDTYRKLESAWRKNFAKAQEIVMEVNGEEQARTLLAPFRGITEKAPLIQGMFAERRIYDYFKKVIAAQNFVKFVELVKLHPFLKEFEDYEVVMDSVDRLYIKTSKEFKAGDLINAKKGCEVLVLFPEYAPEAREISDSIKILNMFYDSLTSNNLINAFSYLSNYPILYETPEAKKLEYQWNKALETALRHAANGDIVQVRTVFELYLPITAKHAAMANVFAQAYAVQLTNKIRSNTPIAEIENGFRNYLLMFGLDETITSLFDLFKNSYDTKLNLQQLKQGSKETWSTAMITSDITVNKL